MEKNKWNLTGEIITNGEQQFRLGEFIRYKATGTNYKGKWRLLGINQNGEVLIMSEENIAQLMLEGRAGYEKGVELLNNICEVYGKGEGAIGARSITIEDIEMVEKTKLLESMIFAGGTASYWLASPFITQYSDDQICGMRYVLYDYIGCYDLVCWDNEEDGNSSGVRAIVLLNSSINLQRDID